MKLSIRLPELVWISLAWAEIIPEVTVLPKPNGLPIAIIKSPTLLSSELPNFTKAKGALDSTLSKARSVRLS